MCSSAKLIVIVLGWVALSGPAHAELFSHRVDHNYRGDGPDGGLLESYTYDSNFVRLLTMQGAGAADPVQVNWETGGARLASLVGRGMVEQHCYDDRGYLTAVFNVLGSSADCDTTPSSTAGAVSFQYQYDGRGNKLQELYGDANGQETTQYSYDGADRLTSSSVEGPGVVGRTSSYTVNAEGLRTAEQSGPLGSTTFDRDITWTLDDSGYLTGVSDAATSIVYAISTDANGRISHLKAPPPPGQAVQDRTFSWSVDGRLLRATTNGAPEDYRYDSHGYRLSSQFAGTTTSNLWSGEGETLSESVGGSALVYERFGELVSGVSGARTLRDGSGSVVGRANSGASIASSVHRYDQWGTIRSNGASWSGAESSPQLAYAGQYADATSGLSYAQQRWYAPELGRFLSEDPVGVTSDRLMSGSELNGFGYAGGNPTRYSDADGQFANIAIGAGIGAAGGCAIGAWNAAPGEEWKACGKGAAVGAVAGAIAGATFGASLAVTGAVGIGGTAVAAGGTTGSVLIGGTLAGAAGGAVGGAGNILANGGTLEEAKEMGAIGALSGAAGGAVGVAAGGLAGGAIAAQTGSKAIAGAVGGIAGGVAGDAASQGVLIAGGVQQTLSGSQLLIAGGLGGGLGGVAGLNADLNSIGDDAAAVFQRGAEEEAGLRPKTWSPDPTMQAGDEAAGVLVDGSYVKNPTAQDLAGLVTPSGKIGGKNMSGQFMYVIDEHGNVTIGSRNGQRMPHPTLLGGSDPSATGAGIVDIRGGRIYSIDNASGHYKPGLEALEAAKRAFGKLPASAFHKDFTGYNGYEK